MEHKPELIGYQYDYENEQTLAIVKLWNYATKEYEVKTQLYDVGYCKEVLNEFTVERPAEKLAESERRQENE